MQKTFPVDAAQVLDLLKDVRRFLSGQEFKTIRGQVNAGDVQGAYKGLNRLLHKRVKYPMEVQNDGNQANKNR